MMWEVGFVAEFGVISLGFTGFLQKGVVARTLGERHCQVISTD